MKDFVRGDNKHIVQNLLILTTVSSLRTIYRGDTKAVFFLGGGGEPFSVGLIGWDFSCSIGGGGVFSVGLVGWDFSCPGGRGVLG